MTVREELLDLSAIAGVRTTYASTSSGLQYEKKIERVCHEAAAEIERLRGNAQGSPIADDEARDNLRLIDHIADKIGLSRDDELSQENFDRWFRTSAQQPVLSPNYLRDLEKFIAQSESDYCSDATEKGDDREPDDEPVAAGQESHRAVTFGSVRRAREAINYLKGGGSLVPSTDRGGK